MFTEGLKVDNTVCDIDLTRTLPPALKNDESILALGRVIAGELQENIRLAQVAIIYARIDELPEELLDILAYDLHVDWYDNELPVSIKRQFIKDSVKIHKRLGTKYAVERAIGRIYPDSKVEEWFEYGGDPYCFKLLIDSTYEDVDPEKHKRVLDRVTI
jgi:phage tail P2-like protein